MSGYGLKALVYTSGRKKRIRTGRGFSRKEISEGGLTLSEARRLSIYIDVRRSSSWPENVEKLKKLHSSIVPSSKVKEKTEDSRK